MPDNKLQEIIDRYVLEDEAEWKRFIASLAIKSRRKEI